MAARAYLEYVLLYDIDSTIHSAPYLEYEYCIYSLINNKCNLYSVSNHRLVCVRLLSYFHFPISLQCTFLFSLSYFPLGYFPIVTFLFPCSVLSYFSLSYFTSKDGHLCEAKRRKTLSESVWRRKQASRCGGCRNDPGYCTKLGQPGHLTEDRYPESFSYKSSRFCICEYYIPDTWVLQVDSSMYRGDTLDLGSFYERWMGCTCQACCATIRC